MNINVFLLFCSFVFLQIERDREREWYIKFGYKEKWSQSYLSYFSTGFHWRIFLLLRANRLLAIFNTGLKKMASSRLADIFFVFFTRSTWLLVLSPTNHVQKLTFLLSISADRKDSPLPFWDPSQSFGFSFFPPGQAIHLGYYMSPKSHSFSIRSPSTNICFSILTWVCYFGIDLHSFMSWRLATVNSNGRIVLILCLSSQWHTMWQYIIKYILLSININHTFLFKHY